MSSENEPQNASNTHKSFGLKGTKPGEGATASRPSVSQKASHPAPAPAMAHPQGSSPSPKPSKPPKAPAPKAPKPDKHKPSKGAKPSEGGVKPANMKARKAVIAVGVVVIAVVVWLLVWMFACNASGILDPAAREGQAPYKTAEEIQAELDRQVDEGMFNISIASVIEFANGTSEGTAYIENVPGNRYNMQVTITDDDTGDVLYESGVIKPNQYIENIKLAKDLDAGSYPATATFTALDPESNDEIGKAAAKVTLNVQG